MKQTQPDIEKNEPQTDPGPTAPGAEALVPVEPATVNAEQLEELKSRAAKADEHWNQLLRTAADFDNFKKRAAREKQDAIKFANESLLEKILPVLDSFDKALDAAQNQPAQSVQSLHDGIVLVQQQLKKILVEAGMEEIDAAGQPFDPNWHEAISQQPASDTPEGHVTQQLRKGYKLNGRLIRPATVIVAVRPTPPASK